MPKLWRFRRPSASPRASAPVDERVERWLVMRALQELAGTTNGVVYDLPRALRPQPLPGSIFVRGSAVWRTYLDAREQVDVGEPAILISMRVLDDDERTLVVDWGTTYANTFLLVEPHDRGCDLSEPLNAYAGRMHAAVEATLAAVPRERDAPAGWTRGTPLGAFLREVFGTWLYWSAPPPAGTLQAVPLRLASADDTLWSRLLPELHEHFPQSMFDHALAYLHLRERELFGGPVPRARSAFRTRLGLPILRDPRCVDRALRRLVNEGRMTIIGPSLPGRPAFGPGRPVPDELSDEEFAQFVMT